MNQRTAKLLRKSASTEAKSQREIKDWWVSLNRRTRTAERKRLLTRLEE